MKFNKSGFTLIEIVIVICLIAIITAVTGPLIMNSIPGIALKSAANDLASDMRLARSLAVKNQEPVSIRFFVNTDLYQISTASSGTIKTVNLGNRYGGIRFGVGMATNDATVAGLPFASPADLVSFTAAANPDQVDFTRDGMVSEAGYVYLCNENNNISYAAGFGTIAGVVTLKKVNRDGPWIAI